jgi:hypothetical protein
MGAGNLAPDAAKLGSILLSLGLVHVSQPLSEVPVHLLGCVDTLNLEE